VKSANDKLIDTELFEAISSSKLILEKIEEALDLKTETERGCSQWFKTHAPETIDQFSQYTDLEKVHFARALGILISNSKKELTSKEGGPAIQDPSTLTKIEAILEALLRYITTADDKSENTSFLRRLYFWSRESNNRSEAFLSDKTSYSIFGSYQKPLKFRVATSDAPNSWSYLLNWFRDISASSASSTSTTTSSSDAPDSSGYSLNSLWSWGASTSSVSSTSTTTSSSDAPDSSGYSLNSLWSWGAVTSSASSTSTTTSPTSPSAAPAP